MIDILAAREARYALIKAIDFNEVNVIVIKANIPGPNKNLSLAYLLTNIFKNLVCRMIAVRDVSFYDGSDGPYYILKINKDNIKDKLIALEESHPLGRFIDLDLFINQDHSLSRIDIGRGFRKCMLCDRPAIQCVREQRHYPSEIIDIIDKQFKVFFADSLQAMINKAMLLELNLEDKFGLVTPSSNGSHQDMDYQLMRTAIDVIIPDLVSMGMVALSNPNLIEVYQKAKTIGIATEEKMLAATAGVNAYKGLIFILGLAIISAIHTLINCGSIDDIYANVQKMTYDKLNEDKINTFGEYAYDKFQFTGARGEAMAGLPTVRKVSDFLQAQAAINNQVLSMALIAAIRDSEDSVLLKRAGSMERYLYFKKRIAGIKTYNLHKIKEVTEECIDNNISCGGAADILITALFINEFINLFW